MSNVTQASNQWLKAPHDSHESGEHCRIPGVAKNPPSYADRPRQGHTGLSGLALQCLQCQGYQHIATKCTYYVIIVSANNIRSKLLQAHADDDVAAVIMQTPKLEQVHAAGGRHKPLQKTSNHRTPQTKAFTLMMRNSMVEQPPAMAAGLMPSLSSSAGPLHDSQTLKYQSSCCKTEELPCVESVLRSQLLHTLCCVKHADSWY